MQLIILHCIAHVSADKTQHTISIKLALDDFFVSLLFPPANLLVINCIYHPSMRAATRVSKKMAKPFFLKQVKYILPSFNLVFRHLGTVVFSQSGINIVFIWDYFHLQTNTQSVL